jgi:hypothetical protein
LKLAVDERQNLPFDLSYSAVSVSEIPEYLKLFSGQRIILVRMLCSKHVSGVSYVHGTDVGMRFTAHAAFLASDLLSSCQQLVNESIQELSSKNRPAKFCVIL